MKANKFPSLVRLISKSDTSLVGRYVFVGGAATAAHYALMIMLVELFDLAVGGAATAGAICGGIVSYLLNRTFTFASKQSHWGAAPRFFLVVVALAVIQGVVVALLTELAVPYLLAQVITTMLGLLIGFLLHRTFSFGYSFK